MNCPERANREAIRAHLECLTQPAARFGHLDLRFELGWGAPDDGPNRARTFRLDEVDRAVEFASGMNERGFNVYVSVTLKRADAPERGRTCIEHAALATCLAVDFDRSLEGGLRKLNTAAKHQLLVLTGRTPEPRGQAWISITPTDNMQLWTEVNDRSVAFGGGDRAAKGVSRLMRLAGTVSYPSTKKKARGYVQEITSASFFDAPTYDLVDLKDQFTTANSKATHVGYPEWASNDLSDTLGNNVNKIWSPVPVNRTNVALVLSMLDYLPNRYAKQYDLWFRAGLAVHYFDNGEVGLALWKKFSGGCPEKASETDFDYRWASLNRPYRGRKITLGWLWRHAKEHGWNPACKWDRSTVTDE
jgi:hypothetical protein